MKSTILIPLLLLPLALASRMVAATPAPTPPAHENSTVPGLAQEQLTVRELMRLEAEMALERARAQRERGNAAASRGGGGVQAGGHARSLTSDAPRLVGIYGVGRRLFAEVRSGPRGFLFLNGHSLPLGHAGGDDVYRLKELAGACVRLARQNEETLLCLPRGGRQ